MRTALDTALTMLSRRALTQAELVQRLEKKGFCSEEINSTLNRLRDWGYLNDREVARAYSQYKQHYYPLKRIRYNLQKRGIDEKTILEVLDEIPTEQEESLCRSQAQKLWRDTLKRWEKSYRYKKSYARVPQEVFLKQRVGQKLLAKGYSFELVTRILEEFNGHSST
ncbi:MAG: RecX family transcriptional regulator [Desulfitobacterium sp.]|nr:RecX family transcriptional regulator [Desulfitobacterium sp.]